MNKTFDDKITLKDISNIINKKTKILESKKFKNSKSYGFIVYKENNKNQRKYLMVKNVNSYPLNDILKGEIIDGNEKKSIKNLSLVELMTILVMGKNHDEIINYFVFKKPDKKGVYYINRDNKNQKSKYQSKFEDISKKITFHDLIEVFSEKYKDNFNFEVGVDNQYSIIQKIKNYLFYKDKYQDFWEFPKGRKNFKPNNVKEDDIVSALRELKEETSLTQNDILYDKNNFIIHTKYDEITNTKYELKFYIAKLKNNINIKKIKNFLQKGETSKTKFFNYSKTRENLQNLDMEKIIEEVEQKKLYKILTYPTH